MFLDHYNKEKNLYERRLQFLSILDEFSQEAFYNDDFEMDEDDPQIMLLCKQFHDVLDPIDLERGLKEIYQTKLYQKK